MIDEFEETYTIVIVTRSMEEADRVPQRTAFFHELAKVGGTHDIFTNLRDDRPRGYISGQIG